MKNNYVDLSDASIYTAFKESEKIINASVRNINDKMLCRLHSKSKEAVDKYFDKDNYPFKESEFLRHLPKLDIGGFDHGNMSQLYNKFQTDVRYKNTRLKGWKQLFSLIPRNLLTNENLLILDFLAGSGTLARKAKQLWKNRSPNVIGIDVSYKMCEAAFHNNEIVFCGSHDNNYFKKGIADIVIVAYGLHHLQVTERVQFVQSCKRTLKGGGLCILHDFESSFTTAKWYTQLT
ncbi:class I SAM-dependent methyltransferase [Candidatus Tisiphia endosymbiont of Temnostethus pusillus]|uniref:class I SAM-dependent methyltransferase n=1 Tax=Candidatus Tisiphia endosymbiont of Temnostethus pusillus TaxID=3139335 RepID=UPI0035C90650